NFILIRSNSGAFYWKRIRSQRQGRTRTTQQAKEPGRGEGSYRRGRRAGKSKPRLSACDRERAWTYVHRSDLLGARGNGILALAADVPGDSDADGVHTVH